MDYYNFYTGNEFAAYQHLGAHCSDNGTTFRTFAPAATKIAVIGDFNDWMETPMEQIYDRNFWECTIPNASAGMRYKYRIYKKDGSFIDHADPYAFFSGCRPKTESIICNLSDFEFQDENWMQARTANRQHPINIYEMHFGSWKQKSDTADNWYSYREMADLLIPYLKEFGYNYLEIMPLNEYPCDESWGYQATGFFSPTSRYGEPDELRYLIDQCHQNEIGVILDFVPVHFAVNDYALWNYDGTALYEYPHVDVGQNEWGSCNFMHSRGEVRSFLQSSAYFWLNEFHFDGLRMDAISNLIYWQGDPKRGENRAAIQFIQNMNRGIKERIPSALLFAEDSTTYAGVTRPVYENGLGFDYKWCLGWMHDTLSYFQLMPSQRTEAYHKLTFSMNYFHQEHYLLPLSHDEVVHGKATIVQKMNGDYEDKFPQARAMYLYMYAHPGAKLNFMGNEFGQLREWDEQREQDWLLLSYPIHDAFHRFIRDLNHCYLDYPALSKMDYQPEGFAWVSCQQDNCCVYAFERKCDTQRILAIFNLSDQPQEFSLSAEQREDDSMGASKFTLLIASDMECYGGEKIYTESEQSFQAAATTLSLGAFSGRYYLVETCAAGRI